MIELKHVLTKYYFQGSFYGDKLFKAEKQTVKGADERIFGAVCWLLDRWQLYKRKLLTSRKPLLIETLNAAGVIMKEISQGYLAFVGEIESFSGAKIDNMKNRVIFDERFESLEKLQVISGNGTSSTFSFLSGTGFENNSAEVIAFTGMEKLVETFSVAIKEMFTSMYVLSPPKYDEEEMFPRGAQKH